MTPYQYVHNNPINLIDPTGMSADGWGKKGNTWEYSKEITSDNYSDKGYSEYRESTSIYSTTDDQADGLYHYSLNANGSVQDKNGNYMTSSFSTIRGTTINVDNGNGSLSTFGNTNSWVGFGATALEQTKSSFRLATTKQGFSPKIYKNGWGGNGSATTYKFAKIGKAVGQVGFAAGLLLDGYRVGNYLYKGPQHSNSVSPTKALVNTSMGVWGLLGGPYGVIASGLYSGSELLYPGGVNGMLTDQAKFTKEIQQSQGPEWRMVPLSNK